MIGDHGCDSGDQEREDQRWRDEEREHFDKRECPDGGTCHHTCGTDVLADGCFRVQHCGPLSGVYPGDVWPSRVRESEGTS